MATFTVKFDTDNAAFSEDAGGSLEGEIVRILRRIADGIENNEAWCNGWRGYFQTIHDISGNDVGRFAHKGCAR